MNRTIFNHMKKYDFSKKGLAAFLENWRNLIIDEYKDEIFKIQKELNTVWLETPANLSKEWKQKEALTLKAKIKKWEDKIATMKKNFNKYYGGCRKMFSYSEHQLPSGKFEIGPIECGKQLYIGVAQCQECKEEYK